MENSTLRAALGYAGMGIRVIPIAPGTKRPATEHGHHDGTTDPAEILRRWERNPRCGVGIVTGIASGIVVVDFDGPVPPEVRAMLPKTATVRTGRKGGGAHHYFRIRRETPTKSHPWGGELRGELALVVAPPTIHPSGRPYEWMPGLRIEEVGIAEFPEAFEALIVSPPSISSMGSKKDGKQGRQGARKGGDGAPDSLPCFRKGFPYRDLAKSPEVAFAIMELCRVRVRRIGEAFICPLHPGEKNPSASLWMPSDDPDGIVMFHHLHAKHDEPRWLTLPEVYAGVLGRRDVGRGEMPVWWIRALYEIGGIELPEVPHPPLVPEAGEVVRLTYEGFVLLLRCREVYKAGQFQEGAPFSWRFAQAWCGLGSQKGARQGIGWLMANDYMRLRPGTGSGRKLGFFTLGDGPPKSTKNELQV